MGLTNLKVALGAAFDQGFAIGSFNVINSDFADAIVAAGEVCRAPLILSIAEVHLKYLELEPAATYLSNLATRTQVPIVIHLDHGMSEDVIKRAVGCGFTSVMIDASAFSFRENLEKTRRIVELCEPQRISVEAELGAVGGSEESGLEGRADPNLYTNPKLVADFVSETGIDALAVAIGNVHGRYKGEPQLDFGLLEEIRDQAGIPLVLHGGSGISEVDFKRAISLGISKVNVFTSMAQAAIQATRDQLRQMGDGYHDYPELLGEVRRSIGRVVEEHIQIFGSSGRAASMEAEKVQ
jgi:fructose-bisphosphate aldolase class II